MFFYLVELGGYECSDQRVLCHEKEFTEEEFVSLIDRIVMQVVPEAIEREFELEKNMYDCNLIQAVKQEVMITKNFGSVRNYIEYMNSNASKPTELTWNTIFPKVVDILIDEYRFVYLKYNVIFEKFERDVIGVVPPVLPG